MKIAAKVHAAYVLFLVLTFIRTRVADKIEFTGGLFLKNCEGFPYKLLMLTHSCERKNTPSSSLTTPYSSSKYSPVALPLYPSQSYFDLK